MGYIVPALPTTCGYMLRHFVVADYKLRLASTDYNCAMFRSNREIPDTRLSPSSSLEVSGSSHANYSLAVRMSSIIVLRFLRKLALHVRFIIVSLVEGGSI